MSTFERVRITVEFDGRFLTNNSADEGMAAAIEADYAVVRLPRPGFWARLWYGEDVIPARTIETRHMGSEYAGGE